MLPSKIYINDIIDSNTPKQDVAVLKTRGYEMLDPHDRIAFMVGVLFRKIWTRTPVCCRRAQMVQIFAYKLLNFNPEWAATLGSAVHGFLLFPTQFLFSSLSC